MSLPFVRLLSLPFFVEVSFFRRLYTVDTQLLLDSNQPNPQ